MYASALKGFLQGTPAEDGALDAGGHMGDIAEGGGFLEGIDFLLGGFALNPYKEDFAQPQCLLLWLFTVSCARPLARAMMLSIASAEMLRLFRLRIFFDPLSIAKCQRWAFLFTCTQRAG